MHLLHKGFIEDYLCWYAQEELFVHNESMVDVARQKIRAASAGDFFVVVCFD